MDELQQRILEIALQLPGYVGYEAKERRRDMDKFTRGQLSLRYEELHTALARVRAKAPRDKAVALENLDQKLLRLIARFETAPRGYAGWFDAAQIVEEDLDALTQFDSALANGVPQLKTAIGNLANAVKTNQGFEQFVDACADSLDTLNGQYDEREQFLASGKKPSLTILPEHVPESPLGVLEAKPVPSGDFVALANLKLNDAVSLEETDYVVTGKITYTIAAGSFWAALLQDRQNKVWLRVGPRGELAICKEVELVVASTGPETLVYDNQTLTRIDNGQAKVNVEGIGGIHQGTVRYARYSAPPHARLWVEEFGTQTRVMYGQTLEASDLKVYRR